MFDKKNTENLYRDKVDLSARQERKLTSSLFQVGSVAVYLHNKMPSFIAKMKKQLAPSELATLKSAMMVAKKYQIGLNGIIKDMKEVGLTAENMASLVAYVKKGIKFIEKAKKKIGVDRFNKLTDNILTKKNKQTSLIKQHWHQYQALNDLIHGDDYKKIYQSNYITNDDIPVSEADGVAIENKVLPKLEQSRLSEPIKVLKDVKNGFVVQMPWAKTRYFNINELPKYIKNFTEKELSELSKKYYALRGA